MRNTTIEIVITCELGPEYFQAWDKLTPEQQDVFNQRGPTKCDGEGFMGLNCDGCPFCYVFDQE